MRSQSLARKRVAVPVAVSILAALAILMAGPSPMRLPLPFVLAAIVEVPRAARASNNATPDTEPAPSQELSSPDELLELSIGRAAAEDIMARAGAYALVAEGHTKEAAEKLRAAEKKTELAQETALNAYFEAVKGG